MLIEAHLVRATVATAFAKDAEMVITGVFRAGDADAGGHLTADGAAESHYLKSNALSAC
jgi:hypothetical protein